MQIVQKVALLEFSIVKKVFDRRFVISAIGQLGN